jgi:3'-phosphoadenosine 5'-phosphosulfate (PAPS) 3'-phosphatase
MVGLIQNNRPVFGCFYIPARKQALVGGPGYPTAVYTDNDGVTGKSDAHVSSADEASVLRIMISTNERKAHPWLKDLPGVEIVSGSSFGVDVADLIAGRADLLVKLRHVLKYWDTAATVAVALGLGLEVGTDTEDEILYSFASPDHNHHVLVGKHGTLSRWRKIYEESPGGKS